MQSSGMAAGTPHRLWDKGLRLQMTGTSADAPTGVTAPALHLAAAAMSAAASAEPNWG